MRLITTAALLALAATAAHAEDSRTETTSSKPTLSIGGGMLIMPDYSGADTYDSKPIPMISASKELTPGNTVYLRGLQAGLNHTVNDQLSIGALANYRFKRDSSDSSKLAGMSDIDAAIEFGPKIRYQLNRQIGVEAQVLFDVSDAHDGYTARVGADYIMPLGEVTYLTVDGGLNYGSSDFNNTYYGVKPGDAIIGRPAYSAGSGLTNLDAGVGIRHSFTDNWSVNGKLGADYLLADVADSPLVDQEFQPRLSLGVTYTF